MQEGDSMTTLKKCPFCGGKAKMEKNWYKPDDGKGGIYCSKCPADELVKAGMKIGELDSHLSSALSLSSAYREALKTILADKSLWLKDDLLWIRDIARAALDRGPEEPVGREVTRDELMDELVDTRLVYSDFVGELADHLLTTFIVERR